MLITQFVIIDQVWSVFPAFQLPLPSQSLTKQRASPLADCICQLKLPKECHSLSIDWCLMSESESAKRRIGQRSRKESDSFVFSSFLCHLCTPALSLSLGTIEGNGWTGGDSQSVHLFLPSLLKESLHHVTIFALCPQKLEGQNCKHCWKTLDLSCLARSPWCLAMCEQSKSVCYDIGASIMSAVWCPPVSYQTDFDCKQNV